MLLPSSQLPKNLRSLPYHSISKPPNECFLTEVFSHVHFYLGNQQICAGGDGNVDPCNGNLGGPLVNEVPVEEYSTLYGIVSYGSDCESPGESLGVYTKVENYVDWIKKNMRD